MGSPSSKGRNRVRLCDPKLVLTSYGAGCHITAQPSSRPLQASTASKLHSVSASRGLLRRCQGLWEERFEKKYGFWRGFVEAVVARYLDCGVAEAGFARLKCDDCGSERLLTLSCKQRGLCPSCDAKRAAAFAAFLKDELLSNVGHSLWTFTLPKMLRPYFMRQRELLGDLARLAYETIKELMAEAVGDPHARPGVVVVPQTLGSVVNQHPHAHCLASRGVWDAQGQWTPVPYIDTIAAEKLFRHKIMHSLAEEQRPFE